MLTDFKKRAAIFASCRPLSIESISRSVHAPAVANPRVPRLNSKDARISLRTVSSKPIQIKPGPKELSLQTSLKAGRYTPELHIPALEKASSPSKPVWAGGPPSSYEAVPAGMDRLVADSTPNGSELEALKHEREQLRAEAERELAEGLRSKLAFKARLDAAAAPKLREHAALKQELQEQKEYDREEVEEAIEHAQARREHINQKAAMSEAEKDAIRAHRRTQRQAKQAAKRGAVAAIAAPAGNTRGAIARRTGADSGTQAGQPQYQHDSQPKAPLTLAGRMGDAVSNPLKILYEAISGEHLPALAADPSHSHAGSDGGDATKAAMNLLTQRLSDKNLDSLAAQREYRARHKIANTSLTHQQRIEAYSDYLKKHDSSIPEHMPGPRGPRGRTYPPYISEKY